MTFAVDVNVSFNLQYVQYTLHCKHWCLLLQKFTSKARLHLYVDDSVNCG